MADCYDPRGKWCNEHECHSDNCDTIDRLRAERNELLTTLRDVFSPCSKTPLASHRGYWCDEHRQYAPCPFEEASSILVKYDEETKPSPSNDGAVLEM